MKKVILTAASLLMFVPCALAQDGSAPPPAQQGPGAPPAAGHAPGMYRHGPDRMAARGHDSREGRMAMHGREHFDGPGGPMMSMWWKNPEVAARIGLSPEQTKKMEDLFLQSKVTLIHEHASLEEEELLLQPLMDANPVDQAKAAAQIDKIADTRAELEKTNAKMLLSLRAVLTAEQWTKLQDRHHGPMDGGHGMHGMRGPGGRSEGGAPAPPPAE